MKYLIKRTDKDEPLFFDSKAYKWRPEPIDTTYYKLKDRATRAVPRLARTYLSGDESKLQIVEVSDE